MFQLQISLFPYPKNLPNSQLSKTLKTSFTVFSRKLFFHDKEDDSNTSNKDTFETLQIPKSKWTPPEGQFASLDLSRFFHHTINNLKSKFSNLPSEEW